MLMKYVYSEAPQRAGTVMPSCEASKVFIELRGIPEKKMGEQKEKKQ
jgi:hypothetical protein